MPRRVADGPVRFGVQTNATLIDDHWAEFFAEHKFNVGISWDGPEAINDSQRTTVSGRGSHSDIMRGIEKLRAAGVRFGVICMVTGRLAGVEDTPAQLYQFFREANVTAYDIHPALTPTPESRAFNVSSRDYYLLMSRLFDAWLKAGDPEVSIQTIDYFFQAMTGLPAAACYHSGMCMSIIGVEPDGDVAPCTRPFAARYTFGNLVREPLSDIMGAEIAVGVCAIRTGRPAKDSRLRMVLPLRVRRMSS